MENEHNYIGLNRETWNNKTQYHVNSEFYDMPTFLEGRSSLNKIELELLGDVRSKKVLHLQCHFGQDTISLSRMGARATGVDFSDKAIEAAREIAGATGTDTRFICCDVYDLPNHLDEQFDIVFTSYGTIGWLPDLQKWAALISRYLKPEGEFIFAEFHPVVWMYDDNLEKITYSYFKDEAIIEDYTGTYADKEALVENKTVSWNHSLSEVMSCLMDNGLQIKSFREYDYSPYNCFSNLEDFQLGKYRFKAHGNRLPMVYSLLATKKL